jgi:hypothetical protein
MCLGAQQIVHTNNQWQVQLKECGEHEFEFWDYNSYVGFKNIQNDQKKSI